MLKFEEKTNGKLDDVAESKQKLEADRKHRTQLAAEVYNAAIAKINGKDIRCDVKFVWVTREDGQQVQKGVEITIVPRD
jgi:hypothetical protein